MRRFFLVLCGLLAWLNLSNASAETWRVAAIEDWPPYMDKSLKGKALGYGALELALNKIGVKLQVDYYPWNRARYLAKHDDRYIGYYCAWPEEVDEGFFASVPIFHSPVVLISKKTGALPSYGTVDLSQKFVALVKSYIYPAPYEGLKRQVRVANGEVLLRSLLLNRVDYGVIDKYVLRYLVQTRPALRAIAEEIYVHEDTEMSMPLVLAFKDTPANRERAERLAAAMDSYP